MERMRRLAPIRRMLLSVLMGALTTVVIAWGCALWSPLQWAPLTRGFSHAGSPRWMVTMRASIGATQIQLDPNSSRNHEVAMTLPLWSEVPDPVAASQGMSWWIDDQMISASGWPRGALKWSATGYFSKPGNRWNEPGTFATPVVSKIRDGWAVRTPRQTLTNGAMDGILPLTPIWSGFLFNTTVFALIWCVLISWLAARTRIRRIAKGRCACCTYSLQGLAELRCPECGASNSPDVLHNDRRMLIAGRVLACAGMGAATTVAVAWGCSALSRIHSVLARRAWSHEPPCIWFLQRLDGPGVTRVAWMRDEVLVDLDRSIRELEPRTHNSFNVHNSGLLASLRQWRGQYVALQASAAAASPAIIPFGMPSDEPAPNPEYAYFDPSIAREVSGWPMRALWQEFRVRNDFDVFLSRPDHEYCGFVTGGLPIMPHARQTVASAIALPMQIIWSGFIVDSAIYATSWFALFAVRRRFRGGRRLAGQPGQP